MIPEDLEANPEHAHAEHGAPHGASEKPAHRPRVSDADAGELAHADAHDADAPQRVERVERGDIPRTRVPDDESWVRALPKDAKNKRLKSMFSNVCAVLRNDTAFGRFTLNTRTHTVNFNGAAVDAQRELRLRDAIEQRWSFAIGAQLFNDAMLCVASETPYDPVCDELAALAWDGVPRLDAVASKYLGNGGAIESTMVRKWLIAAVARAMRPGCKVDTMLVLQSAEQGRFKSTFFAVLGGEHFCDSVQSFEKDGLLAAHRSWIIELGELDGITRKSDVERVKNILSRRVDDVRRPYARNVESLARSFVFCGTVNSSEFLHDSTGNRRFWCVEVRGAIDVEALAAERGQLLAEAVAAYRAGERWWLSAEEAAQAELAAEPFVETAEAWDEKVKRWLDGVTGEVTMRRVLVEALGFEDSRIDRSAQTRAGNVLRRLGLDRVDVREGDGKRRVYRRRDERVRVDVSGDGSATDGATGECLNLPPNSDVGAEIGTLETRTETAVVPIIPISTEVNRRPVEDRGDGDSAALAKVLVTFSGEIGTDESAAECAGEALATHPCDTPKRGMGTPRAPLPLPVAGLVGPAMPYADGEVFNDLHEPE